MNFLILLKKQKIHATNLMDLKLKERNHISILKILKINTTMILYMIKTVHLLVNQTTTTIKKILIILSINLLPIFNLSVVSNNDNDHSLSDDISLEYNIKNTNLSSKRKLSVTEESNSKRRTNESSYSLNLIPLKHKLKNSNSSSNKKFKSSFNELTKRPGSLITPDDNKKLKVTIDNVEPSIKNIITDTPLTYKQAVICKSKEFLINAIKLELKNFYDNKTMSFVKVLPDGKVPISTKWIFTIKKDGLGNISKYKARLVARGFT